MQKASSVKLAPLQRALLCIAPAHGKPPQCEGIVSDMGDGKHVVMS